MVVVRVKRVWDGSSWEDVEFLCSAEALDAPVGAVCSEACAVHGAHAAVERIAALLAGREMPPQAQEMVARALAHAAQLVSAQQVAQGVCVHAEDMRDALAAVASAARAVGVPEPDVAAAEAVPDAPDARFVWCRRLVDPTRTVAQLAGGNPKTVLNMFLSLDGSLPLSM